MAAKMGQTGTDLHSPRSHSFATVASLCDFRLHSEDEYGRLALVAGGFVAFPSGILISRLFNVSCVFRPFPGQNKF
jgi:hypothetical protein